MAILARKTGDTEGAKKYDFEAEKRGKVKKEVRSGR
jgi:hypothetical protein